MNDSSTVWGWVIVLLLLSPIGYAYYSEYRKRLKKRASYEIQARLEPITSDQATLLAAEREQLLWDRSRIRDLSLHRYIIVAAILIALEYIDREFTPPKSRFIKTAAIFVAVSYFYSIATSLLRKQSRSKNVDGSNHLLPSQVQSKIRDRIDEIDAYLRVAGEQKTHVDDATA